MGIEYKIKFSIPQGYDPSTLLRKLTSPIHAEKTIQIYNYAVEQDGFYFMDHLVDNKVASVALRRFVDEALSHGSSVEIVDL
jgi:hypothetical protein